MEIIMASLNVLGFFMSSLNHKEPSPNMVLKAKEGHGWILSHNDWRKGELWECLWLALNNSLAKLKGLSNMLGIAEPGFMITQIIFLTCNQLSNYELTR